MNRRDFIKQLALIAAGSVALPEQIAAFESYYNLNTPLVGEPFISFDGLTLSGLATRSSPIWIDIFNGNECVLPAGINAFGGIFHWIAAPDQKIIMPLRNARWKIREGDYDDDWVKTFLCTKITYMDQEGIRCIKQIDAMEGCF